MTLAFVANASAKTPEARTTGPSGTREHHAPATRTQTPAAPESAIAAPGGGVEAPRMPARMAAAIVAPRPPVETPVLPIPPGDWKAPAWVPADPRAPVVDLDPLSFWFLLDRASDPASHEAAILRGTKGTDAYVAWRLSAGLAPDPEVRARIAAFDAGTPYVAPATRADASLVVTAPEAMPATAGSSPTATTWLTWVLGCLGVAGGVAGVALLAANPRLRRRIVTKGA